MKFKTWAKRRDWWKADAPDAFEPIWNALIASGLAPEQVGAMLDRVAHAMAEEFGGSF